MYVGHPILTKWVSLSTNATYTESWHEQQARHDHHGRHDHHDHQDHQDHAHSDHSDHSDQYRGVVILFCILYFVFFCRTAGLNRYPFSSETLSRFKRRGSFCACFLWALHTAAMVFTQAKHTGTQL